MNMEKQFLSSKKKILNKIRIILLWNLWGHCLFSDALHLEDIKAVVLDYNWRDVKAKKIIDIPDVKKDLLNLMKEYLLPHIHNTKCKIAILW